MPEFQELAWLSILAGYVSRKVGNAEEPGKNHSQLKERRTYKRFMEKYGFVEDPVRLGNRTIGVNLGMFRGIL